MCRRPLPDRKLFDELHRTVAPGDHYGLAFPISPKMLAEFGTAFLTKAFRASGVMSADNEVTEIVELKPVGVPGASERSLLTLAYARDEPGLHTHLFAKFPPADPDHKFGLIRLGSGEVDMQRLGSEIDLPVTTAKYYFGDHCARTTNFILITERIAFGVPPVEPAYRKGYDHEIGGVEEHYALLARSLAHLVAAHKCGRLGPEIESLFPFGGAARDFDPVRDAGAKIARLSTFVTQTAPQLFVAEAREPSFMERWAEDVLFGLEHKDAVIAYLHANRDYTGLCHPNLNVDNAWYWRDPAGRRHVGLLDWGGAGQMSIAQALSGMMMMPQPLRYAELVDLVLGTFVEELADKSGVVLDPAELRLQYKASLYSTAIAMILDIVVGALDQVPVEAWASLKSQSDLWLAETGLIAAIIWIDNILREWCEEMTPGDACREIVARSAVPERAAATLALG
ncbi:hypothetical protein [Sphingobium sp. TomMM35A]